MTNCPYINKDGKECGIERPDTKFMCLPHWRKVPLALQKAITDAYRDYACAFRNYQLDNAYKMKLGRKLREAQKEAIEATREDK